MGPRSTGGALAANDPTATVVVAVAPPFDGGDKPPPGGDRGGISQTTEHLLIAAGSIGNDHAELGTFSTDVNRCHHHSGHDCPGHLHHAQARSHARSSHQARETPSHTARSSATTQVPTDLGLKAVIQQRLRISQTEHSHSPTSRYGPFWFSLDPEGAHRSRAQRQVRLATIESEQPRLT